MATLSERELQALEGLGFNVIPASEDQAARLRMQLRVFMAGGRPVLVTRGDGYYETQSTLKRLLQAALKNVADAPAVPMPASPPAEPAAEPQREPEPPVATAELVVAPATMPAEAPAVVKRQPRRRAPKPGPAQAEAAPTQVAMAPEPPAALATADQMAIEATAPAMRQQRPARRATATPRWVTAGAVRRGRKPVGRV